MTLPREIMNSEIKKGDKLTYLHGSKAENYYAAVTDWSEDDNSVTLKLYSKDGFEYPESRFDTLDSDDTVTLLERDPWESLPVGAKFSYLIPECDEQNYYVKTDDGVSHFYYGGWTHGLDPSFCVDNPDFRIIDTNDAQEGSNTMNTADEALDAKLDLAVDFELQIKFNYTNEHGETADRRLKVQGFDGVYVGGVSYDANGYAEGYKRFRIDRINDRVVVR